MKYEVIDYKEKPQNISLYLFLFALTGQHWSCGLAVKSF